eukprot:66167-Rhodomonas_salina.1
MLMGARIGNILEFHGSAPQISPRPDDVDPLPLLRHPCASVDDAPCNDVSAVLERLQNVAQHFPSRELALLPTDAFAARPSVHEHEPDDVLEDKRLGLLRVQQSRKLQVELSAFVCKPFLLAAVRERLAWKASCQDVEVWDLVRVQPDNVSCSRHTLY